MASKRNAEQTKKNSQFDRKIRELAAESEREFRAACRRAEDRLKPELEAGHSSVSPASPGTE
jgi:hypothetical protein